MDKKLKIILVLVFISLGILVFSVASMTGKIIKSSKPSPRILPPVRCEKTSVNNIPKIELTALVKNFGGNGKIIIVGEVDAENNEFDVSQEKVIYFEKGESKEIVFYFDGESIFNAKCYANAKAFSSG